jgi:CRP-like cAMP-binding protein
MTPEKLLSYNLPLFADLGPADFKGIVLEANEQSLHGGQTLFDQEDSSRDLYFLLSGTLLAVYWTPHGREIVYARFPIGAYFGELAALQGVPRSLAIVAKSPAKVLALSSKTFLQIHEELPLVRQRVNTGLVNQIRTLTHKNMEMVTLSVEERTIRYLQRLATDAGALTAGSVISNAPTHSEIAGSIGANREMVSRTISKLSKQGVIKSSRQKIIILDPAALITAIN